MKRPAPSGGSGRRFLAGAMVLGTTATLSAAVAHADMTTGSANVAGGSRPASTTLTASAEVGVLAASRPAPSNAATGTLTFRTLDDPKDPTFNQLLGINDHGRIAGYFGSGADAAHPNRGYQIRGSYLRFVDENVPRSVQTQVVGINNRGVTAGFFVDKAGANVGFVYSAGRFTAVANPLTAPAAPFNQLLGINDHGIAVGFYNDAAGTAHGYTYDTRHRSFHPVMLPVAADAVTATGINNDGDVSGFYVTGKATRGFVLERNGRFHRLSFGAGTNTQALGVNDADQAVGSFVDAAGAMHGFVWSRGHARRVDAPNGSGGTLVNGLNNRGQLVGFYVDAAGLTHGFLAHRGQ
jgi:uncharacterized membrane protein